MNKNSLLKTLVIYYGLLQIAHLAMNIFILSGNLDLLLLASPQLPEGKSNVLLFSLFMDLIIYSPLGVAGATIYFFGKQSISKKLIKASLIAAVVSAFVYVGILLYFNAFILNATSVIFAALFTPVIILIFTLLLSKK